MPGLGFARALLNLGTGAMKWGGDLADERETQQTADARLATQGYFRHAPKPAVLEGTGVIERTPPGPDLPAGGDLGEEGWSGGRADPGALADAVRSVRPPATVSAPDMVAPPLNVEALKTAVRTAAPKDYADNVQLGGNTYEYQPERTPEGRRSMLQQAQAGQGDRAAYQQWSASHPDRRVSYDAARGKWQDIVAQDIGRESRAPALDPALNRQHYDALPEPIRRQAPYIEGHDYKPDYDAFVRGEIGQQNRVDFRVQFPPNTGGGGGLTPTQEHARAVSAAHGKAIQLAGQGVPENVILDFLRQNWTDVDINQLAGIAASAAHTYAPHKRGRGSSAPVQRTPTGTP